MALNLASPGVKVREVDLTIGRIDGISQQVGGFAGPFEKGPINTPVFVETEADLLNIFGKPLETDSQNEYWMSASNYLSYGGVLRVVRVNSDSLNNANSDQLTPLKIESSEDFESNHINDTTWKFAAKTPGSWANGLKICVIDDAADQIISGVGTTAIITSTTESVATKTGDIGITTNIITGITTSLLVIGDIVSNINFDAGTSIVSIGSSTIEVDDLSSNGSPLVGESFVITRNNITVTPTNLQVGYAVTQTTSVSFATTEGTIDTFNGYIRGIITGIGKEEIHVKVIDRVSNSDSQSYKIDYRNPGSTPDNGNSFGIGRDLYVSTNTGVTTAVFNNTFSFSFSDWYDNQTLGLTNSTVYWKSIAPKPKTSEYAIDRSSKNDSIHVVVIDDSGKLTGTASNILEKHTFLSKAIDARISPYQGIYFKSYIKDNSPNIYAGLLQSDISSDITVDPNDPSQYTLKTGAIGLEAQSTSFNLIGNQTYELTTGVDYDSNNGMDALLSNIVSGYNVFRNPAEYSIDFLIQGPSGGNDIYESIAKANALISIAEERKDCIACISPHKADIVNITDSNAQTQNIIEFFEPITSSSYAVFDSGIKYTLDRYNNKFIYLETNSDIAGLMARTANDQYPWFSPAGSNRGSINNAIKLAYNPSQAQRDLLYTKRINPVIASPGEGIILFGDKTGLSYGSAFDRINVRRLFLTIEKAISRAARSQLFEFNDEITRNNFINIVEPYLRDIKGKRGITEFVVICDETNNTPEVVDSNQLLADIFVKPARSINFIGLTFVATRTGVSFTEVIGNV